MLMVVFVVDVNWRREERSDFVQSLLLVHPFSDEVAKEGTTH